MKTSGRIVVVARIEAERGSIAKMLETAGHKVFSLGNIEKLVGYLAEEIDIVFCDVVPDRGPELAVIQQWREQSPRTAFILIAAQGLVREAVAAMKAGAHDYLLRPMASVDSLTCWLLN